MENQSHRGQASAVTKCGDGAKDGEKGYKLLGVGMCLKEWYPNLNFEELIKYCKSYRIILSYEDMYPYIASIVIYQFIIVLRGNNKIQCLLRLFE